MALRTVLVGLMFTIMVAGGVAQAADYTLRATANSNEADEDADGLNVFKQFQMSGPRE